MASNLLQIGFERLQIIEKLEDAFLAGAAASRDIDRFWTPEFNFRFARVGKPSADHHKSRKYAILRRLTAFARFAQFSRLTLPKNENILRTNEAMAIPQPASAAYVGRLDPTPIFQPRTAMRAAFGG